MSLEICRRAFRFPTFSLPDCETFQLWGFLGGGIGAFCGMACFQVRGEFRFSGPRTEGFLMISRGGFRNIWERLRGLLGERGVVLIWV